MNQPHLWLSYELIRAMTVEAEAHAPSETGGIVLGYWAKHDEVVATVLIGPGPDARHWPTGFMPDNAYQEDRLAVEYERSGRRLEYLGDWHSHPSSTPTPSDKDTATMKRIAADPDAGCPRPLMLILGERDGWELGAWILRRRWRWWSFASAVHPRLFMAASGNAADGRDADHG